MLRITLTAGLLLCAAPALAEGLETAVRADLAERGYSGFDMERANGTLRVVCHRAGMTLTVLYNAATGEVLSQTLDTAAAPAPEAG